MIGGVRHAFLEADTIRLYRRRHPGATPDDVRARYLGRVPRHTVEHSCVYHGERGCVLERDERADICNRYHCNPQMQLLGRWRDMAADKAVILAEEDGAGPRLATYDTERGWRPCAETAAAETAAAEAHDGGRRAVAAALAQVPPHLSGEGDRAPDRAPAAAPAACAWCGIPIGRHKAVTTRSCGRPACESRRMAEVSARVEHRQHEQQLALVAALETAWAPQLDAAAGALGVGRDALVVGVVPRQDAPVLPLPAARRAAFAAHLAAIAAEGFAIDRPGEYWSPESATDRAAPETGLAIAACSTCQGSCCRLGGPQMAFLTARDVCRYRLRPSRRRRQRGSPPAISASCQRGQLPRPASSRARAAAPCREPSAATSAIPITARGCGPCCSPGTVPVRTPPPRSSPRRTRRRARLHSMTIAPAGG